MWWELILCRHKRLTGCCAHSLEVGQRRSGAERWAAYWILLERNVLLEQNIAAGPPGGYRACQSTQVMLREEMWSSGHDTQHLTRSSESQVLEMAFPQEAGWSDQGLGAPYTPESVSVKWGQWWSPRFYYSNFARFKLGSFRTVLL